MEETKRLLMKAVELAKISGVHGNHPCGAVIADQNGKITASSGNEVFTTPDIAAHAEMLCLKKAGRLLMDKKSEKTYTLYSSTEPCCGCAFFIARTNIKKVIYASKDRYRPGISVLRNDLKFATYFDTVKIVEEPDAVLRNEALILMRDYFLSKNLPAPAEFFKPL